MDRTAAANQLQECLRDLKARTEPIARGTAGREIRPAFRFASLLRFALGDLLGLPVVHEPIEKVRWALDATFRGFPVVLEDRKLGFYVYVVATMDQGAEDALIKRLLGATRIVAMHVRTLAESKIASCDFTLENNFVNHDEAYRFFRTQAAESYAKPPPPPIVEARDESGAPSSISSQPYKYVYEGNFYTVAMVNEYFSRLEHVMIHLLPARLDVTPTGAELVELMGANWTTKFNAVFPLDIDQEAKRLYDRLHELKEDLRNPSAHGSFMKGGKSAWFHVERIGALPMDLLDRKFDSYSDPVEHSYDNICALFDEVDDMMRQHPTIRFGMLAVEGHLDAEFDSASLSAYRAAIKRSIAAGDSKPFENYIAGWHHERDAYNNYEF